MYVLCNSFWLCVHRYSVSVTVGNSLGHVTSESVTVSALNAITDVSIQVNRDARRVVGSALTLTVRQLHFEQRVMF